ncbi:MAG: endonuclease/exonuclease/phosphatase family protein [Treponema sp.]|jgi:endonuclease/exonuclease/phosphatase family metal-dependent hydrolase|nr:endonuclease/exonuclease/phosphatase family protein [Treponema sp.]
MIQNTRLWLGILAAVLVIPACSGGSILAEKGNESPQGEGLRVVSWNLQALFDGADDGHEYGEYRPDTGWTAEKYQARLNAIAGAIKGSEENSGLDPDILALIEVENPGVLADLADLAGPEYRWSFFAAAPGAAIGLGALSRFPIIETRAHSAAVDGENAPRPVAEIRVEHGKEPLVFLICHWKSKLGGEKKTETARRAAAAIISRRLDELAAAEPGLPVIIMGDLNENHDEFLRAGGAYLTALIPGDDEVAAAAVSGKTAAGRTWTTPAAPVRPRPNFRDFLTLSGERPPRSEFLEGPALYSPWMDGRETEEAARGSYHYKDAWETIDHFLLNAAFFDETGWEYGNFSTPEDPPFRNDQGIPRAYNPRTGSGLSDHLPIILTLDKVLDTR